MKYLYHIFFLSFALTAEVYTGIPAHPMTTADNYVKNFLFNYNVAGFTIAVAKDGRIVYMRGFDFRNQAETIPVQLNNHFRIGGCSRQITSIAIMKVMQQGRLTMTSKVFVPGGLLEHGAVISIASITDSGIDDFSAERLLMHTSGWNRDVNCNPDPTLPYPCLVSGYDPITNPLKIGIREMITVRWKDG